jgi:hypothetical protein
MTVERLLNVLTALSIGLILLVLRDVRRAHIRVEYSVSWLGAAAALLVLSRSNSLLQWLGRSLGVADPSLGLLFVIGCLFFVVFYRSSIRISELKDSNISLAQRVAILEFRLRSQDEKQESQTL